MKKNNVFLFILCLIYIIVSLVYIFGIKESVGFNIIQFIILYVPFFCFIVFNNKKWALYMAMFFCIIEGLAGILNSINYIRMFIQLVNQNEIKNQLIRFLSVSLGNFIILATRIIFIYEGIRVLKAKEEIKNKIIISVLIGLLILTVLGYILSSDVPFYEYLPTIRSLLFTIILYGAILSVFGDDEFKCIGANN